MAIKSKFIVYYVMGANNGDESQLSHTMVQNKKQLEKLGWEMHYGVIVDRTSIGGLINNFLKLNNEVKNINPSIIHSTYGSVTGLLSLLFSRNRKLKVQYRGDDILDSEHKGIVWEIRSQLNIIFSLIVAHFADPIIVVSNNLLDKLPKHFKYKINGDVLHVLNLLGFNLSFMY